VGTIWARMTLSVSRMTLDDSDDLAPATTSNPSHISTTPPVPVDRTDIEFRHDTRRVILKPYLPDEQIFPDGGLLDRIFRLTEEQVTSILSAAMSRFEGRHPDTESVLEAHFRFVAEEAPQLTPGDAQRLQSVSSARRLLIGAYFTGEFSIEAASLTNPSMVPAPDQSGLEQGTLRFIVSLRGIGEGHVSSIEFRSGLIDKNGRLTIDLPTNFARTGHHRSADFDKPVFCSLLKEMRAYDKTAKSVCDTLPDRFELHQLEAAIAEVEGRHAPRHLKHPTTRAMHWLATSNYQLGFPPDSDLSERVIFPGSAVESEGMEDARFVRFLEDDGSATYYATYTAYDGAHVLPQLIETSDFVSFRIDTLSGACAQNKGAALFPRKIDGRYAALSRYDSENNYVMMSDSLRIWDTAEKIESPEMSWELGRIGNCGSPLETEAGWLVITHGVGPFRTYSLGAMLLDMKDPTHVIGRLKEPLLTPTEEEREGYVPNVVYSCGSMLHGDLLVLPYGFSDVGCRLATVPLDGLLGALTG
jgi:predicted GH43/DUF377 family glycosyl hydrolase